MPYCILKRPILLCLGLALVFFSCKKDDEQAVVVPCVPAELLPNLLAFYPFTDGSTFDFSGNCNHLRNPGFAATTTDRNNNLHCAYLFEKRSRIASDYLIKTNPDFLNNLSEISISLWFQPLDTLTQINDYQVLVCRTGTPTSISTQRQWSIALFDCQKVVFDQYNPPWDISGLSIDCNEEDLKSSDIWTHLVATYNQSSGLRSFFINGVLEDLNQVNVSPHSKPPSLQNLGDLFLGTDYQGKLDDVLFFDKTLNQEEITKLYQMAPCCESCSSSN